MKALVVVAVLIGLNCGAIQAQDLGNSPYSRLGIGDYNPNVGGVRQMAMGGVGVAAPNATNVNELNPALLYYTARTTFEAGYIGQYKTVQNSTTSGQTGSGSLRYLALAVPLGSRWGAAVGLKPLSAVDYQFTATQPVNDDPTGLVTKQYQGTGELAEAYLAQGFHINKSLSLGATVSYITGLVDETTGSTLLLSGVTIGDKVVSRVHNHYSDFAYRAAAHYRHKIGKSLNLNLGGVYSFQANIGGVQISTQERQDGNGSLTSAAVQTNIQKGNTIIPALKQVGISIDNDKNWSINFDAAQQQWSKFSTFTPQDVPLHTTLRFGLGGEITPDPGSVEHYYQRISYRAGISVAQLPYQPSNEVLYDRSVSWGFAFPVPTASPLDASTLSLAFTYGIRGNTSALVNGASNVQETYIKAMLGVTLNNRWFIKRRLQ